MEEIYECFGIRIMGYESTCEGDAWETFDFELKRWCKWLKGYKYWRSQPRLACHDDYEKDEKKYRVRARIICSEKELPEKDYIKVNLDITYDETFLNTEEKDSNLHADLSGLGF